MIRDAADLLRPDATRFEAEVFASTALGIYWASAGIGHRDNNAEAVRNLISAARRHPSARSGAALAAYELLTAPDLRVELRTAADELGLDRPAWADSPAPAPVAAWLGDDPWSSTQAWFVSYDEPQPHVLLAAVVQPAAGVVASLSVTGPDALMEYAVLDAASDIPAPRRPHDPALALAALREALTITDVMWPRTTDELYMQHRALVWARINDHAAPALSLDERLAVDPLPDQLREELREAFLDEFLEARSESHRDRATYLVDVLLDYAAGSMPTHPLSWAPPDAAAFLSDYVPHTVLLLADDVPLLPELSASWVTFLHERIGTDPRWVAPVVDAIEENAADLVESIEDESSWGPADQLSQFLAARGIDTGDAAQVQDAISELTATQNARRLLLATADAPPVGSALRVTVALQGVDPAVWRRLVLPADITLDRLHPAIQAAMGWRSRHEHMWTLSGYSYGEPDPELGFEDEHGLSLYTLTADEDQPLVYIYDFGDEWTHVVRVGQVLFPDEAGEFPRVEDGRGACPPEDVGGAAGYAEFLRTPTGSAYDAGLFDVAAASERVRAAS